MNNNIAIKVENLSKIYKLYDNPVDRMKEALHWRGKKYHKDFYALNDVSFEIKKGETVGIIGKNGSGKSTLLKIITGVLTPTSGKVTVNGKISALLELGAGFNPEYTGIENIYFQGNLMGYTREQMDTKVDDILAFADIGDFVYQPVKMYSSGMFARLAFAVAINVEPDILIVDEALSVGDMFFQEKCLNIINDMVLRGTMAVLFVSHSLDAVRNFCDRALWISAGNLYKEGSAKLLTREYSECSGESRNFVVSTNFIKSEYISPIILGETLHKAIIKKVNLNKESYITGEDLEITITVSSADIITKMSIGIIIRDDNGSIISLFNPVRDGFYVENHHEFIVKLVIASCDLLSGYYNISISLTDIKIMAVYDMQDGCVGFRVNTLLNNVSKLPCAEGVIRLKHSWVGDSVKSLAVMGVVH